MIPQAQAEYTQLLKKYEGVEKERLKIEFMKKKK